MRPRGILVFGRHVLRAGSDGGTRVRGSVTDTEGISEVTFLERKTSQKHWGRQVPACQAVRWNRKRQTAAPERQCADAPPLRLSACPPAIPAGWRGRQCASLRSITPLRSLVHVSARAARGWLAVLPVQQTSNVLAAHSCISRVLHTSPNNERLSKWERAQHACLSAVGDDEFIYYSDAQMSAAAGLQ